MCCGACWPSSVPSTIRPFRIAGGGGPPVETPGLPSGVLLRGTLSFEIEGHFTQLELDGALLYADEVVHLIGGGEPQQPVGSRGLTPRPRLHRPKAAPSSLAAR